MGVGEVERQASLGLAYVSVDLIVIRAAIDQGVVAVDEEHVIAGAAAQLVGALGAIDNVIAAACVERIIPAAAVQLLPRCIARDDFTGVSAN